MRTIAEIDEERGSSQGPTKHSIPKSDKLQSFKEYGLGESRLHQVGEKQYPEVLNEEEEGLLN
jgi:hypothetical protein